MTTRVIAEAEAPRAKVPVHVRNSFECAVEAMRDVLRPVEPFRIADRPEPRIMPGNMEVYQKIAEAEELNNLLTLGRIAVEAEKLGLEIFLIGGMNVRRFVPEDSMRHTHDLDFAAVVRQPGDEEKIRRIMVGMGYTEESFGFGLRFKKRLETDTQASLLHHVDFLINIVADASSGMVYVFEGEKMGDGKRLIKPKWEANYNREPPLAAEISAASIYDQVIMKALPRWRKDQADCYAILANADGFDFAEFGKRVRHAHLALEELRKTPMGEGFKYSFGEFMLARLESMKSRIHSTKYDEEKQANLRRMVAGLQQATEEYTGATLPEIFKRRLE